MYNKSDNMNEIFTPTSLMTPNTIKTIEQSILASLEGQSNNPTIIASAATGCFVPPLPNQNTIIINSNNWQGGKVAMQTQIHQNQINQIQNNHPTTISYHNNSTTDNSEESEEESKHPKPAKRKTGGGRKPRGVVGEEDDKKVVRRERNKLAAARCRKRRVDQTNRLVEETDNLESKRRQLQDQIQKYTEQKSELEFILEAHLTNCNRSIPMETKIIQQAPPGKPLRPTTLPVFKKENPPSLGIPISTPSNGLVFEMDWLPSTGLTPTATAANGVIPLMTPNTINAVLNSLQTPTCTGVKFVNL